MAAFTQQLLNRAYVNDLGELSIAKLIELSGCDQYTADLGLVGDEWTLKRFLAIRKNCKLALPERLNPSYDVAGDFVDVGLYLSGEPECMFNYDAQFDQSKFIDVTIRIGRPSRTEDYKVFYYYANVLQAIDILESQGLRCRITATADFYNKKDRHRILFRTPIKEYSEPVNMAVFAGVILNNDFFSTAVCDTIDNYYRARVTGYSYCSDMVEQVVPQSEEAIIFPSMYFNRYDRAYSYPFDEYLSAIGLGQLLNS
ncbi:DUF7192 family protein [Spirosoma aerolatum]|uniref:DUF7192 family protein n=1 Tax=Spirosoma aerolatum TaxID=1211326 RepID=UPI0009ACB1A7|nr:hypothetical protein [Spirosoma aerolatum]